MPDSADLSPFKLNGGFMLMVRTIGTPEGLDEGMLLRLCKSEAVPFVVEAVMLRIVILFLTPISQRFAGPT